MITPSMIRPTWQLDPSFMASTNGSVPTMALPPKVDPHNALTAPLGPLPEHRQQLVIPSMSTKAPDASSIAAMPDAVNSMAAPKPPMLDPNPLNQQEGHMVNTLQADQRKDSAPFGSPTNHPGFMGKLLHGLSMTGNIAGDIFAPAAMANIPGTMANRHTEESRMSQGIQNIEKEKSEEGLQGAQTEEAKAQTGNIGAETAEHQATANAQTHAAEVAKNAGTIVRDENGKPIGWQDYWGNTYPAGDLNIPSPIQQLMEADHGKAANTPEALYMRAHPTASPEELQNFLAKPISTDDAKSRNSLFDPIAKKYGLPTGQFRQGMTTAEATAIQTELNNAVGKQQGAQRIQVSINENAAKDKRADQNVSRQDVRAHDKAYVQPAEAVEKSYQMMNDAYNEYEAARRQGKELPTGAQSMLALSTHLATTFGNVKGARVTKDMIQEHLGARGISDAAEVAVQRLTDGDVLSPQQWDAFHNMIADSRKLTWKTAVKEANRKNIPVDFLPPDLNGLSAGDQGVASSGLQITRDANGRITGVK